MTMIEQTFKRAQGLISDPMNSGPALAVGRRVFGNNAGFKQNVVGGLEIWNARRNGPFSGNVLHDDTARAVETIGYAKAPWRLESELVDTLEQRFEAAISQKAVTEQFAEDDTPVNVALKNPLSNAPEIREVFDERMQAVVHAYFGSRVRIYTPDYWRNFHVKPEILANHERFSERWHNDSGKVSILSVLILMSDVNEEHGATWCATRTRTREIFREGLQYREHGGEVSRRLETDADSVRFTGQRGDMWFLNTRRTLHRAGIPGDSLQRDILGLKFTPHAGDQDIWDETPAPEEKDLNWQSF